jgi:hypothetical protein
MSTFMSTIMIHEKSSMFDQTKYANSDRQNEDIDPSKVSSGDDTEYSWTSRNSLFFSYLARTMLIRYLDSIAI